MTWPLRTCVQPALTKECSHMRHLKHPLQQDKAPRTAAHLNNIRPQRTADALLRRRPAERPAIYSHAPWGPAAPVRSAFSNLAMPRLSPWLRPPGDPAVATPAVR
jgi:hypothetical protein